MAFRKQPIGKDVQAPIHRFNSLRGGMLRNSAEIILEADNIIFPEIIAELDFYKYQRFFTRIVHTVQFANRDINERSRVNRYLPALKRHDPGSGNHRPFFGALQVLLQAKAATRFQLDPLHLNTRFLVQHTVMAPRLVFGVHRNLFSSSSWISSLRRFPLMASLSAMLILSTA